MRYIKCTNKRTGKSVILPNYFSTTSKELDELQDFVAKYRVTVNMVVMVKAMVTHFITIRNMNDGDGGLVVGLEHRNNLDGDNTGDEYTFKRVYKLTKKAKKNEK